LVNNSSRIVGGSAGTWAVGTTKAGYNSLKINAVDGLSNSGLLPANPIAAGAQSPAVGALAAGVNSPFLAFNGTTHVASTALFLTGSHITSAFASVSPPTFPASGPTHPFVNPYGGSATVVITGGTLTAVFVNGVSQGTGGTYTVPAAQPIYVTYTGAPKWTWVVVQYTQANGNFPATGMCLLVPPADSNPNIVGGGYTAAGNAGANGASGSYTWQWGNPTAPTPSGAGGTTSPTSNWLPFTVSVYLQGVGSDALTVAKASPPAGNTTVATAAGLAGASVIVNVQLGPGDTVTWTTANAPTWQWDTTW
ncbi:MAG: hypothetical protein L3K08_04215, partial [Thermoplasmata archaeon]|nr:hypothetical protein [Thermoplasmata archaeon]